MDDNANNNGQFQSNNPQDTNPMQDMTNNQQMPEDNGTPAAPADDVSSQVGAQDPATDSNVDADQQYQEGNQAATSVDPPAEPAVTDYTPPAVDDQQGDTPQQ